MVSRPMARRKRDPGAEDVLDTFDALAVAAKAEVMEEWRERAAIREYLGGYSRPEAERLALQDAEAYVTRRAPQKTLF